MSATAYITSGILERHAMGLTTPEEAQELREMASQHPGIREEIASIRQALRAYVLAHQVAAPDQLREELLASLQAGGGSKPGVRPAAVADEPVVRPIKENKPVNLAAIAAAILGLALVVAAFTAYSFFSDAEAGKTDLAAAQTEIAKLNRDLTAQRKKQEMLEGELSLLRSRETEPIQLRGTNKAPNALATIYWNGKERVSHIDVKRLPDVPEGQKLQLWVVVDRTPQKLGSMVVNDQKVLPALRFVEAPEAYYATLEKADEDVVRPNLRQVVMYTNVDF